MVNSWIPPVYTNWQERTIYRPLNKQYSIENALYRDRFASRDKSVKQNKVYLSVFIVYIWRNQNTMNGGGQKGLDPTGLY